MQRRTGGTSRKSDWSSRSFSIFGWLGVCLCKSQTRWSLLRGFPSGRVGDWKYCRQFEDVKLRGYHISMMDVYFFFVYKSKCWKIFGYITYISRFWAVRIFPTKNPPLGWSRFPHPRFHPNFSFCFPEAVDTRRNFTSLLGLYNGQSLWLVWWDQCKYDCGRMNT